MAEHASGWVYEESFGEKRALLIENGHVSAAKLYWRTSICAGNVLMAKVVLRPSGSKRALCLSADGHEIEVPDLPRDNSEGSQARIIIHREPMAERGRLKRAHGRFFGDKDISLPENDVLTKGEFVHRLPKGAWEDVWSLASDGEVPFAGGNLIISITPAMTLIDIDGGGSPKELALAAVPAIAKAIRWFDLGGSIGIDFPTIAEKSDRKQVDAALAAALDDWAHERTAMNGFGFVHLVARMKMPSLLHRFTYRRAETCARYLLRQASHLVGPGKLNLACHPAIRHAIPDDWLIELGELTGKAPEEIVFETEPTLALDASQAQLVRA